MIDSVPESSSTVLFPPPATAWQLEVDAPEALPEDVVETTAHELQAASPVAETAQETPPSLARILEALLFAAREPVTAEQLGKLIRGLTPSLIESALTELNKSYRHQGRPYCIVPQALGYRIVLRTSYRHLLELLFGGTKEARFSQLALETLSIVGYCQPVDEARVEEILGQPCNTALRQLIRRGMVQLEKNPDDTPRYSTTRRFLEFFQLSKVEDLPRADDLERL